MKQNIFKKPSFLSATIILILLAGILIGPFRSHENHSSPAPSPPPNLIENDSLKRIVDGDTLISNSGKIIRLLGIDTPELGEPFAKEAADYLEKLLYGKKFKLVYGNKKKDKYNRYLAHIIVNNNNKYLLISEELIRRGLGSIYIIPPNFLFEKRLKAAQKEAVEANIGIWSIKVKPEPYYIISSYKFHRPSCPHVQEIKSPKRMTNRTEILKSGKSPCRTCKP